MCWPVAGGATIARTTDPSPYGGLELSRECKQCERQDNSGAPSGAEFQRWLVCEFPCELYELVTSCGARGARRSSAGSSWGFIRRSPSLNMDGSGPEAILAPTAKRQSPRTSAATESLALEDRKKDNSTQHRYQEVSRTTYRQWVLGSLVHWQIRILIYGCRHTLVNVACAKCAQVEKAEGQGSVKGAVFNTSEMNAQRGEGGDGHIDNDS